MPGSPGPLGEPDHIPTLDTAAGARASALHPGADPAGFEPGAVIAGRYRIVALLGRGGMGEVYRADDLTLGVPVALKRLPPDFARDPRRSARLREEVRLARQVSHPYVARVFDILDTGGQHLLVMEYIDGEDLASLLRRIGRLPTEKAVEIARQLCAGLAAAHADRIIHRDLKPANIMIDGRGRARITDFGLAVLADDPALLGPGAAAAGTPHYMAPEQLAGREVTRQSDIYSLGLVLYELFTGRPAYGAATLAELKALHSSSTPPENPSSLVADLDPAVERTILRCLNTDPGERPNSALAVAAGLPGGDPIAAALAAGETPSPEMVAHSGQSPALRPRAALACLIGVVLLLALLTLVSQGSLIYRYVPLDQPTEVHLARAEDLLKKLGYTDPPVDYAYGFRTESDYLNHIARTDRSPSRWERLRSSDPPAVSFWYRVAPEKLTPTFTWMRRPSDTNPPQTLPGHATISIGLTGRLEFFEAIPPERLTKEAAASPAPAPDWNALLSLAGLDLTGLTPTTPLWTGRIPADTRAAWLSSDPQHPDEPLRIEAAAARGRPVAFRIERPWDRPVDDALSAAPAESARNVISNGIIYLVLSAAAFLAWRHLRSRRGDRTGALRVAIFFLVFGWLGRALSPYRFVNIFDVSLLVFDALAPSLVYASLIWLDYIALEPFVRRIWPHMIISWTRLLRGGFRDPLVGRDILVGCVVSLALALANTAPWLVPAWLGQPTPQPSGPAWEMLEGGRQWAAGLATRLSAVVFFPMVLTIQLIAFRAMLRKNWAAYAVSVAISATLGIAFTDELHWTGVVLAILSPAVLLLLLVRFGLVAVTVILLGEQLIGSVPLTTDLSAWYAGPALINLGLFVALAVYGYITATAGRSPFAPTLPEPART